jgi:hypothetical protein
LGAKAVGDFQGFREAQKISNVELKGRYSTDFSQSFFIFNEDTQRSSVKTGVVGWIKKLRAHPKCTQYTWDLLDLIEEEMFEIERKKRINLHDLHLRLRQMREKLSDPDYGSRPRRHGLLGKLKLGKRN